VKRTQLQRHTALKSAGQAKRKRPKGPLTLGEHWARELVYARSGGLCERCGLAYATEWHHRRARSQRGPWEPSNGLHLCSSCHGEITETRTEYYVQGWLVHSWADWAETPVTLHYGRVLLDNAGAYRFVEEDAA
jgi:hypothetical protein